MKLLNLPRDILLHLVNTQFSLQELIHLRLICAQLCHLIESRHCIGRRRTLKLFWSFSDLQRYTLDLHYLGLEDVSQLALKSIPTTRNDVLVLNGAKFSAPTCDLLVRLLPRVEHLTIYFTHTKHYPDYLILRHMFAQLSGQLTGLSLFGWFNHSTCDNFGKDPTARSEMDKAFSQLTSLKQLDMCLDNLYDYEHNNDKEAIVYPCERTLTPTLDRIIPQLEHLTFCFETANFEQDIVRHLGPQCTSLRLHRVQLTNQKALPDLLVVHSIQLNHLQLTQNFIFTLSNPTCFTQLRTLELFYFGRKFFELRNTWPNMKEILVMLVPLERLIELSLVGFKVETFQQHTQVGWPILSGIRHLSINASNRVLKNQDTWFNSLSRVFPAVHHLTFASININCTVDPVKQVSSDFDQCTHFRLLHLHYRDTVSERRHIVHDPHYRKRSSGWKENAHRANDPTDVNTEKYC